VSARDVSSIGPQPARRQRLLRLERLEGRRLLSVSIGDRVWLDANANGVQDPGEPGVEHVLVNLYDSDGVTPIDSTTTAADGSYSFQALPDEDYTVEVVAPAGFSYAHQNQGDDNAADSNVAMSDGRVASATPLDATTIDAGLLENLTVRPASVQIQNDPTQVTYGFVDVTVDVPGAMVQPLAGYSAFVTVDALNSEVTLTGVTEGPAALFPGQDPGYFDTADPSVKLISDFLPYGRPDATITDGAGLFRLTFAVAAGTEGTFDVEIGFLRMNDGAIRQLPNVATAVGTISIAAAVETPMISIDGISRVEGNDGTTVFGFPITVEGSIETPISVQADTLVGTAEDEHGDGDYASIAGRVLTFDAPGTQILSVDVIGDGEIEPDEFFAVVLSNPTGGAEIVRGTGFGVIRNDDTAAVVGRHVFYNNSSFDGNDGAANADDDLAVASDKRALLPGEVAGLANYTSFDRGVNGIMIDIEGLPDDAVPEGGDFQFRVGNDPDLDTWAEAPASATVVFREGAGVGQSDRVTVTWADYAVRGTWLQVTVLGANLGLPGDDVFYFGNAVAEAGNSSQDTFVTTTDMLLARNNSRNFLNPAGVEFAYDYNRDGRVGVTDVLLARNNTTNFLNTLKLIDLSGTESEAQSASAPPASAVDLLLAAYG